MARGFEPSSGDRGVSTTLTVVLLIGITLVGIVAVIAIGWVNIDDANEQARMEIAEESMLKIDSTFQQSSGSNTSVTIPDELQGQVSVSNDARYTLLLNENRNCSTGSQEMSGVVYESSDETIAYEGGGVWHQTESGATMTSPPDINYDDGSLSVSFIQIEGQISAGETLQTSADADARARSEGNLTRLLYTNATYQDIKDGNRGFGPSCSPSNVQNATLLVENSQYARAWADWARSNYDSRRVTTNASGTVEAGDTVRIHFLLGDVSDPYFNVSDVRYNRSDRDTPVEVTATVTNTGGLAANQSVAMSYAGFRNSTYVELGEDEQKRVTLEMPGSNLENGDRRVTVRANNSVDRWLNVSTSTPEDALPVIELSADEPFSSTVSPDEEMAGAVLVENTGNMTTRETVTLWIDGSVQDTWDVTLDGGEQRTVYVNESIPTSAENPVYDRTLNVSGDVAENGQTINRTYDIAAGSTFEIQSFTDPADVSEGDDVSVTATVANTGDRQSTEQVSVVIEEVGGPEVADTTTDITLSPDSSTTVTANVYDIDKGEYEYTIETPNESRSASFYVDVVPQENFRIRSTSVPDRTLVNTTESFNVVVENSGKSQGTQEVTVVHDDSGQVLASDVITIDSGDVGFPELDVKVESPPFDIDETNDYTIRTANDTETGDIQVYNGSIVQCTNGSCTNEVGIRAEIVLEGVEEEGFTWEGVPAATADKILPYSCDSSECYVPTTLHTPVRMKLVLENESGVTEQKLWEDEPGNGNLNHPDAEAALIDERTVFNRSVIIPANTTLSFNATRYDCSSWDWDDVTVHQNIEPWNYYEGVADIPCTSQGDAVVSTRSDDESLNVATFTDGDEVIGYRAAGEYQIPLTQLVDGQITTDGDGEEIYDLRTGEKLYTLELTERVERTDDITSPLEANQANSAYDYNDAVVRYRTISIIENYSSPPLFEVGFVEGPNRVDKGNVAEYNVTIRNVGGRTGTTPVTGAFPGTVSGNDTVTLAPGASTNLTFRLDTSGLSDGSYAYTFDATANTTDLSDESSTLFVGQLNTGSAELRPTVQTVDGVEATDEDEGAQAVVEVNNIGSTSLSSGETVTLFVEDENGHTTTVSRTVPAGLSLSDPPETFTIDLPSSEGDYEYYAEVDGHLSGTKDLFVGDSHVELRDNEPIRIHGEPYNASSRIDADGSVSSMEVNLENTGSIGDYRRVNLTIRNSSGGGVFTGEERLDFGDGRDLRTNPNPENGTDFSPLLDPGYYTYNITVFEGSEIDTTYTGGIYLRNTTQGEPTSDDAPVEVSPPTRVTASD